MWIVPEVALFKLSVTIGIYAHIFYPPAQPHACINTRTHMHESVLTFIFAFIHIQWHYNACRYPRTISSTSLVATGTTSHPHIHTHTLIHSYTHTYIPMHIHLYTYPCSVFEANRSGVSRWRGPQRHEGQVTVM